MDLLETETPMTPDPDANIHDMACGYHNRPLEPRLAETAYPTSKCPVCAQAVAGGAATVVMPVMYSALWTDRDTDDGIGEARAAVVDETDWDFHLTKGET